MKSFGRLKKNPFKGLVADAFNIEVVIKNDDMVEVIAAMRDALGRNNMETYESTINVHEDLFILEKLE